MTRSPRIPSPGGLATRTGNARWINDEDRSVTRRERRGVGSGDRMTRLVVLIRSLESTGRGIREGWVGRDGDDLDGWVPQGLG